MSDQSGRRRGRDFSFSSICLCFAEMGFFSKSEGTCEPGGGGGGGGGPPDGGGGGGGGAVAIVGTGVGDFDAGVVDNRAGDSFGGAATSLS